MQKFDELFQYKTVITKNSDARNENIKIYKNNNNKINNNSNNK